MGETTEISWCDATFNPWMGCEKVSPGCAHCYAERDMDHRWGKVKWGKGQERVRTSDANWRKPLAWDRKAKAEGVRRRVFCASLADVFDPAVPKAWRRELLQLIDDTPNLDWLLLTKRPGLVPELLAETSNGAIVDFRHMPNVWLGTTVEDQARADERIPQLLAVRAAVRFLSCEPLLGPLELGLDLVEPDAGDGIRPRGGYQHHAQCPGWCDYACGGEWFVGEKPIHWIIAGGESGPGARPSHPDWFRSLRDQCQAADVPFHFKQWGEWKPICAMSDGETDALYVSRVQAKTWESQEALDDSFGRRCTVPELILRMDGRHRSPGDPEAFRSDVPGWPAMHAFQVGKSAAGRLLDGRTWDGVPS
jgi:protein gp37